MRPATIALVVLLVLTAFSAAEATESIGVVVGIQGKVVATRPGGMARELGMKSEIFLHDTIKSEEDARVQIMFEDDTLFAQGANSEVEINEYVYDPEEKEENGFLVRLGKGIFRVITGKITDLNPERFKIKTGRATIGIRGCELGFEITDDYDLYLMTRIPPNKKIFVDASASTASRSFDPSRQTVIEGAGGGILIDDAGNLKQIPLETTDFRHIFGSTGLRSGVPFPQKTRILPGTQPHPGGLNDPRWQNPQPIVDTEFFGKGEGSTPKRTLVFALDPSAIDLKPHEEPPPDELYDTALGDTISTDGHTPGSTDGQTGTDGLGLPTQLTLLPNPVVDTTGDTGSSGSTGDSTTPQPTLILSGGAAGSDYFPSTPPMQVTQTYIYDTVSGAFSPDQFDGVFAGNVFDTGGNPIGVDTFAVNVGLANSGNVGGYFNYDEVNVAPGVFVMNDNLQQFVTVEDLNVDAHPLTYVGYEARGFPGSELTPGYVYEYDIKLLEQPPYWDTPTDVHDPQNVTMYVNPHTGAFYIPSGPNNLAIYGSLDALTFYGQESQGVGAVHRGTPSPSQNPIFHASILAGFQIPGAEQPRETGSWTHNGYAMARTWPDPSIIGEYVHHFNSAGMNTDTVADNEGHVIVMVDKDSTAASAFFNLDCFEDPLFPATTDIRLGAPDNSFYVNDENYSVEYYDAQKHIEVVRLGGGTDWNWGKWMGEREIDYGTGVQVEQIEGEYVEGATLSPTAFDALVQGAQSFALSTVPGSDWAEADVGNGFNEVKMSGGLAMNVNIPGGGSQPTWEGIFTLSGGGPDALTIETGTQDISSGGHLNMSATPTVFTLDFNGTTYAAGDLNTRRMSGNLVGPGTGSTPITGAIGDGRFVTWDGVTVDLLYGTDLQ